MDRNPNVKKANSYRKNLLKHFKNVNESQSLSDGYIKAIKSSKKEYLFMLEHDWVFESIPNTLEEIIQVMEEEKIMHLRFNQRENIPIKSDKYLKEVESKLFKYCRTPSVSNNPHIINKRLYERMALPLIKNEKGSKGIEEVLCENENVEGCIYGGLNYPRVIVHTDGRREVISLNKKIKNSIKAIINKS
jgi:hypothetical protein